ncbi:uncharacterized protein LOC109717411 [Ananas comosus]|uniref:Late embryogenesis abundant protein n=1 Tax=Ananas comosus TaxID=4615 RepID=A0A199VKC0_ANACO|nr:uncharacterized protein LOC109717411 [Ananas comosus]OAY77458.1 Late embryogenesis abundant protein [Ananas comosus]
MAEKMSMKEQAKPLALPSPAIHPTAVDEEEAVGGGASRFRSLGKRRRAVCCCCSCCGATTVVLGVVLLVLFLTVFKVKDPTLTMNSLTIDSFNLDLSSPPHNPVSANVTLTADISIKNPNAASFRFGSSATEFYYEGATVGVAYAPAGRVGADRTVRMNVTVDVLADQLASRPDAGSTILSGGDLNLTTHTDIAGRVSVLGIYKRHIKIAMNCSVVLQVSLTSANTTSTTCDGNVH